MTSSTATNDTSPTNNVQLREHQNVTTIQNLYNDIDLFQVNPATRRSFINKSAYAKLHRSASTNTNRHSVVSLKGKFETSSQPTSPDGEKSPVKLKDEQVEHLKNKYSPISFGYPAKPAVLPKPRHLTKNPKDENSNLVFDDVEIQNIEDTEEREIVLKQSTFEESIEKIHKELSSFTMEGKPKERKRSNSFRKLFSGGLFGKDKKKKEEGKNRAKGETVVYNENMQNESSFKTNQNAAVDSYNNQNRQKAMSEDEIRNLERQYAEMHVNSFNKIRQTFADPKPDYAPMGVPKKASISDYISAPVKKYIDTSSSTSSESEKPTPQNRTAEIRRDTPPRAQETYQNFILVKPKASIPISSERPLPNPYQTDKASPRTIERNLNRSNSKDYPDKPNFSENKPRFDETYGTVFDSLDYVAARNGEIKPVNSRVTSPVPKSPSLEGSKLKLPPNREIYDLQPRVKSPIPVNRVSTDKIIATELLRSSRSPTPPKKIVAPSEQTRAKPPLSPQVIERKSSEVRGDRIVTNAMVHTPRSQTPLQIDSRDYGNIPKARSTPADLRMSALQLSPQKDDIRKSVEEYYWKELKKLKEQEDYDLYMLQMSNGLYGEPSRVRRSRSLSPATQRFGRASLSLPREGGHGESLYGRIPAPQAIPEDQTLIVDTRRKLVYDPPPNFVRNRPERRTVGTTDSLQRPIFRRGSLNKQELYDAQQQYNKKVSFISPEAWPTKNGYTQSPPQRRLDKRESLEDEVFLPNPEAQIYYSRQEPLYSNRVPQYDSMVRYQDRPRMVSMDSIPRPGQEVYMTRQQIQRDSGVDSIPRPGQEVYMTRQQIQRDSGVDSMSRPGQEIYVTRQQVQRDSRKIPPPPPKREVSLNEGTYGQFRNYQQPPSNQLYRVTSPVYSSRQSIAEPTYSPKQVTVSNKFCDIYGQIHDVPHQKTGVLMGQLQQSRGSPVASRQPQQNFVRGTRLTASVNDMGRRYPSEVRYVEYQQAPMNYDSRPLPPIPGKKDKFPGVSDTESGSDASEIQRIMQNKPKVNKKRGFFGK